METLGKIFGKAARVKVMRLFLFNPSHSFTIEEVSRRSRIRKDSARSELKRLATIGMLNKKTWKLKVDAETKQKTSSKKTKKSKKTTTQKGFVLNKTFALIEPLRNLLIETELVTQKDILKRLRQAGKIDLLLLSGIFIRDENRSLDVLVVGNKLKPEILARQMAILESEIGRELSYAQFDVEEFTYRMGMYDKLLRDVLENHHEVLVNRLID